MRIQSSGPTGDFKQPRKYDGVRQVTKPVVYPLSDVGDYEMQVSVS